MITRGNSIVCGDKTISIIDLKRVRYFLKLAETLSFSRASEQLGISQPGLTKSIAALEADLGESLIRREGRNTHLTPFGKAMLAHFRDLDNSAMKAEQAAQSLLAGEMAILRIGLMCTIGPSPLTGFLTDYQTANPDLEITLSDLTRDSLAETLLSGEVDVALVGAEINSSGRFRYIDLYNERMVVACAKGHPLENKPSVNIETVTKHPYVDRLYCEFRETFLSETRRRDFAPMISVKSDREDWAQAMVAHGAGVALVPDRSAIASDLVLVPLADPILERTVSLAVPIGREDNQTVRDFLKAVRRHDWG